MATPAAILSILVKADGVRTATAQLGQLEAAGKKAGATVDDAAKKHRRGGEAIKTAAKVGTLALGGLAAGAVKMAADYEQSMNTLQAVSGATGAEMKKLGNLAIKLGADVKLPGTSAKDASEAMTEMVKAGVSLKDTMAGARGVLVLSAAAQIDNARAAEIASNALNAFRLKGKDVNFVVDQLANTANSSSVEITDVADSFKMASAVFNAFQTPTLGAKKAMTELNVAIGLLGNAGIKGSDAGTSLKQALLQLTGPSNKAKDAMQALYFAAKGNSGAEGELTGAIKGTTKERGKALASLAKLNPTLTKGGDIAFDSAGKMRSLKNIIALVTAGTRSMTDEQKDAYLTQIFGADAVRSITVLMQAQDGAWGKMEKSVNRTGAAQDLANAKMKGFNGSVEALKSTVETLAISFGTTLLPPLTTVLQKLAGAGPLLEENKTLVMAVVGALGLLAAGAYVVNLAMAANPYVRAAIALAALVVVIVKAYQESETFRGVVLAVFNAIKTAFTATVSAIQTATDAVVGEIRQWDTFFSAISRGFDLVKSAAIFFFDWLKTIFKVSLIALGPIVTAAWTLIKGIFSGAFTALKGIVTGGFDVLRGIVKIIGGLFKGDFRQMWDGVKTIFTGGIKALKGILEGAWKLLKAPVEALAAGLHDAFKHSWDRIKDVFSSAINVVIGFLNVLISAINAIPGVPDIPKIGKLGGGGGGSNVPVDKKARGGAYARTGGLVNAPITLMGEEAPRHPEFVIPTNPMYRGRAKGLLAQAASAIGMQAGGRWGIGALGGLWERAGGAHSLAQTMAIISSAESGVAGSYGYQFARNPSGATGLWQILGQLVPGDLTNAMVNARNAVAKYKLQGLGAWTASKSVWGPLVGNFPGTAGPVGAPVDLESILSKFPSPSKLPDMFQGLGKYVIGKATSYVKKQIGGLFTGGGNLGNKGTASGLSLGVQKAIELASGMGWAYPSPGQLTGGRHAKGSLHYSGRAVDFGTAGHSGGQVMGLWQALLDKFGLGGLNELFYDPAGRYIDNHHWVSGAIGGHGDHIHAGFRKGGKWLGSFKRGGITSSEGLAHLHANEAVIPLKKGGRHVTRDSTSVFGRQNKVPFRGSVDRRLINPPKGVIRPFDPVTSTVPEAAVATEENTSATDALTEATNRLIELNAQVAANQLKILALTNQGPQILAAVVAAVSGGIGGRTGLGFQSPSYAGGMARYR